MSSLTVKAPPAKVSRLFSFPDPVNEVSARIVAGVVALIALTLLITGWSGLVLVLAYGFVARALTGPTLSPLGQLATRVVTPALGLTPKYVPGPPKRFAQSIGAGLALTAAILTYGFNNFAAAQVLIAAVFIAATLESVWAFCLGCQMFRGLMKIGVIPESVCERCHDINAPA